MKTQHFEFLFGGAGASHLSRDAMMGLNSLGRRFGERVAEDELFETAIRKADEEQLRQLARLRLNAAASKHLD